MVRFISVDYATATFPAAGQPKTHSGPSGMHPRLEPETLIPKTSNPTAYKMDWECGVFTEVRTVTRSMLCSQSIIILKHTQQPAQFKAPVLLFLVRRVFCGSWNTTLNPKPMVIGTPTSVL